MVNGQLDRLGVHRRKCTKIVESLRDSGQAFRPVTATLFSLHFSEFSSQRDARPLVSVNRWASKAHPVRPTPFTSVGRAGQLATASRKLRRRASRVLALYLMIYQRI
jgi:hypothetical protein